MNEPVLRLEPNDQEVVVKQEDLHEYVKAIYFAAGVSDEHATTMADLQVETDVRGVHSHGTRQVSGYIQRCLAGHTNPRPEIVVVDEGPAYVKVDNNGGFGHLGTIKAMDIAIEKALVTGVAIGTVIQSRHFGAAFNYAMRAAKQGMIGWAISSSSPGLAPWGGAERMLGNNPFAYAVPACDEEPLVLDMASGVSAWGRIGTKRLYGEKLTMDWVLDKEGHPTDDPHEAAVLLPFGGIKGSGLSVMMDVLASILPFGVATTHRRGAAFDGQQQGTHFVQAIDIAKFVDIDEFKAEMDRMIQTIRSSRKRPGYDRIYLPGEIEWLKKKAWSETGIPIHIKHAEGLEQVAEEVGITRKLVS
ncbi:MAG: Ldh family oxidoreductase [Candidatus Latescibacterota bacterium]|nr:Ldh family oxidoreductase [Candidatus Latescibacterota bacterium]